MESSIIQDVKAVPITAYLQSKNILPAHKLNDGGRNDYAYCSPLSNERTPSFFVNEKTNVFYDYSTGQKGDVIRLVQQIERINFTSAVRLLQSFTGIIEPLTLTDSIPSISDATSDCKITAIKTLQHPSLLAYVENKRGIPYEYASRYVKQIHYSRKAKNYFGVGFKTDSGTWAIRAEGFKAWIGRADITTIPGKTVNVVHVFEGFFNYLSALTYFGKHTTDSKTIILNSVSHVSRALPELKSADMVHCWLDNDRAGRKAVDDIRSAGCNVHDRSNLYSAYNDFNEYLTTR